MPFVRIDLLRGKSAEQLAAVCDGIYQAMRETFDVPENDRFMVISQHDAEEFDCDRGYLGIARSDELVIIQITCADTRSVDTKRALYRRIADKLAADPGLRKEDVFINLLESGKENWSFGNGMVQHVPRAGFVAG